MVTSLPTAYLFFAAAAVLLALPKGQARGILLLAVPLIAALHVWTLPEGHLATVSFLGLDLDLSRVDRLSRVFGLIFCLFHHALCHLLGQPERSHQILIQQGRY